MTKRGETKREAGERRMRDIKFLIQLHHKPSSSPRRDVYFSLLSAFDHRFYNEGTKIIRRLVARGRNEFMWLTKELERHVINTFHFRHIIVPLILLH